MDLRETGWGSMDCIYLAQDRNRWKALLNTVMNLRFPYNIGKFLSEGLSSMALEQWIIVSFSAASVKVVYNCICIRVV
jgi:hypothetical protein